MDGRYFFSSACSYCIYRNSVGSFDAVLLSASFSDIFKSYRHLLERSRCCDAGKRAFFF